MKNTWNNLTAQQKRAFGDRFITNNSNLESWNKDFGNLSELKQNRVIFNLTESMIHTLLFTI